MRFFSIATFELKGPLSTGQLGSLPGEHVLGGMGFQQAVAAKVTKDPLADGVLEAIQELGRETGGFVEAEATGLGFGVLIHFGDLEQAVHHTEVEMIVGAEGGAEAVEEAHGPVGGGERGRGTRRPPAARSRMWRTAVAIRGRWWR